MWIKIYFNKIKIFFIFYLLINNDNNNIIINNVNNNIENLSNKSIFLPGEIIPINCTFFDKNEYINKFSINNVNTTFSVNNYDNNNNLNNNNFNHNNFNNNCNNFNNNFNNLNNNNFNQNINENPENINNIMNEKINERNNSNISQQIQYLKSLYDLNQIPDIKIEEAIKKANGNLDEVIKYLFP